MRDTSTAPLKPDLVDGSVRRIKVGEAAIARFTKACSRVRAIAPALKAESHVPRYHFNVYDGVTLLDKKGVELPDTMFARREAIRYAGVLLEEGARLESLGSEWRMEVTDGVDLILFRLDFFVTPSPVMRPLDKPK